MANLFSAILFLFVIVGDIGMSSYTMLVDQSEGLECTIESGCEGENSEEKEDSKSEFFKSDTHMHLPIGMSHFFYKSNFPSCQVMHQYAREIPVPPPDFV